jgi:two-component system, OmpR family, response regulator CpxR
MMTPDLNILLIDDDVELCALMREFFAQHGMGLEAVHDGRRGLARAFHGRHDLVLLDVMLPGLDGFELLRQVRRRSLVPVIMLTARTAQADRILGLNAGADDYLPKPFGPEELLARVRAVLRRVDAARRVRAKRLDAGPVRIAPGTREAWCDDRPLRLTPIEFNILEIFVRSAGRVLSRDELTTLLHQRRASPFDRSLDVHISHIRKKLGWRGDLIQTVRGVGYLFRADLGGEAE